MKNYSKKSAVTSVSFNNKTYKKTKLHKTVLIRYKKMADLVEADGRVLDVACGYGSFMKMIKNKCLVEGVEISKKATEIGIDKGLKIKTCSLEKKLPFNNNSFDGITAGEIIEHLYDTDFFLKELYRVLKPKGYLIISTPNIASLGRRLMLLFGRNPNIETNLGNKSFGHIRYFTKQSLKQLLLANRFKPEYFTSTIVNFSVNSNIYSELLARFFPTLGSILIFKCRK